MRHSVRLVLQQVLKGDSEVFQNRDLTGIDLDYLFLDGSQSSPPRQNPPTAPPD